MNFIRIVAVVMSVIFSMFIILIYVYCVIIKYVSIIEK